MERIQVNVTTGERQVIALTPEEIAQAQAQAQEYEASITYAQRRAAEYPSIVDQLDTLYHGGYDAWKAEIQAVKERYPKP
jgi:hypothetical protein